MPNVISSFGINKKTFFSSGTTLIPALLANATAEAQLPIVQAQHAAAYAPATWKSMPKYTGFKTLNSPEDFSPLEAANKEAAPENSLQVLSKVHLLSYALKHLLSCAYLIFGIDAYSDGRRGWRPMSCTC